MSYRANTVLIARLLSVLLAVAFAAGAAQTQAPNPSLVVALKEGESVRDFAERHQASITDAVGNAYLLSAPALALNAVMDDPAVIGTEQPFEVEVSERTMLPTSSPTWLQGDVLELLTKMETHRSEPESGLLKQPALDLIGCEDSEYNSPSGRGIRVAVIDTGIDWTHPVVSSRILPGFNFIDNTSNIDDPVPAFGYGALNVSMVALLNPSTVALLNPDMVALLNDSRIAYTGHGTLVSGLIATVAPGAFIVPLKAFDSSGHASSLTVAKAIRYAADLNVDVINMSFDFDRPSMLIRHALDYAASKGIILVASAGNNDTETKGYPAIHPAVIAVASTTARDHKARFSNYGSAIAIAAPGEGLISAFPGGHYAAIAGTSFSAALVTAEAALIRSAGTLPPATVLKRIQSSSKKIESSTPGVLNGVGRIRVSEAIEQH